MPVLQQTFAYQKPSQSLPIPAVSLVFPPCFFLSREINHAANDVTIRDDDSEHVILYKIYRRKLQYFLEVRTVHLVTSIIYLFVLNSVEFSSSKIYFHFFKSQ